VPDSDATSPGASTEEVLKTLLPIVVQAATSSAEGAASSAKSIASLETSLSEKLTELLSEVKENNKRITELVVLKEAQEKLHQERGKWLRSLLTPQTILWILAILGAAIGIRLTIPMPLTAIDNTPAAVEGHRSP